VPRNFTTSLTGYRSLMLARRSFCVASRVRVASEQKTASVNGFSKVVETHAKVAMQKSTGILRNPNMTLTTEEMARGRLATLGRRTDQARLEEMRADGSWWTGKAPNECAGWVSATETSPEWLSSLALPDLAAPTAQTRQQTLDYFDNTWTLTELLCTAVREEATLYLPPCEACLTIAPTLIPALTPALTPTLT
jgi:hypothetical protein